jgi:SAM-dependent methyltransferase
MPLFAATVALSALLLFLVQPIIAKQILPWFGGTAGVWAVCMVFFQSTLLAGYAYAHGMARTLRGTPAFRVHATLLALSLLVLPIVPPDSLKPRGDAEAAPAILLVLAVTIGLPYLLLSSTGPLVQWWIAHRYPARSVYRLFALSNLGSLAGLIAFPFVVEPLLSTRQQALYWSIGYLVFAAACGWCAWQCRTGQVSGGGTAPGAPAAPAGGAEDAGPLPGNAASWLALSALGVILLLSTTNQLLQNVASAPFLWIVPLAVYLLSFIVVFDAPGGGGERGWYGPHWGIPAALLAALIMAAGLSTNGGVLDLSLAVPLYAAGLFFTCVFCHGELAARRPPSSQLTRFYLMLSLGGAAGGVFVALVAPRVFDSLYELPLALLGVGIAAFLAVLRRPAITRAWSLALLLSATLASAAIAWADWNYLEFLHHDLIVMQRNFYGTLRVREVDDNGTRLRRLLHGVILHGEQPLDGPQRREPGSYYSRSSGVGLAIAQVQARKASVHLGVIGLGVGTLAAYGRAGDRVRFYEIDRDVLALAKERFGYLGDTPARVEVVLGDARLSLERELAQGVPQGFDVLAVDAFASDSIPVHLLTREAIAVYRRHLAPGGIIAVHISNRFLDLQPVLANIAAADGLSARLINDDITDANSNASSSEWVLIAQDAGALDAGPILERGETLRTDSAVGIWTDETSNLMRVLKTSPWLALQRLVASWRETK